MPVQEQGMPGSPPHAEECRRRVKAWVLVQPASAGADYAGRDAAALASVDMLDRKVWKSPPQRRRTGQKDCKMIRHLTTFTAMGYVMSYCCEVTSLFIAQPVHKLNTEHKGQRIGTRTT